MNGRYRVKIMNAELADILPQVGVWDTLASEWVSTVDGPAWSTTDPSRAQYVADSMNDAAAAQYAAQQSVTS